MNFERQLNLRASIMDRLRMMQPSPCFRSLLVSLATTIDLDEQALDLALSWLSERRWIVLHAPKRVMGRTDREVSLTAFGDEQWQRQGLLRAAIMMQLKAVHPSGGLRTHLVPLAHEGALDDDDLDMALAWLSSRQWIRISEPTKMLGRYDKKIDMTTAGIDVALKIDSETLEIPERL